MEDVVVNSLTDEGLCMSVYLTMRSDTYKWFSCVTHTYVKPPSDHTDLKRIYTLNLILKNSIFAKQTKVIPGTLQFHTMSVCQRVATSHELHRSPSIWIWVYKVEFYTYYTSMTISSARLTETEIDRWTNQYGVYHTS